MMVGREINTIFPPATNVLGPVILRLEQVGLPAPGVRRAA
jgi:hypothetical protein